MKCEALPIMPIHYSGIGELRFIESAKNIIARNKTGIRFMRIIETIEET